LNNPKPLTDAELEEARTKYAGLPSYQSLLVTIDALKEEAKADDWFRERIQDLFKPFVQPWRDDVGEDDMTVPGFGTVLDWLERRSRLAEAKLDKVRELPEKWRAEKLRGMNCADELQAVLDG
jgi:hypothetical protein